MSSISNDGGKKWINSFTALSSIFIGYCTIAFFKQLGEWFYLEAKIPYFNGYVQALGAIIGIVVFLAILKNKNSAAYLSEVYAELTKVVWPDKDSVVKATIGIIIGVSICSGLFVAVDFLFRELLELFY